MVRISVPPASRWWTRSYRRRLRRQLLICRGTFSVACPVWLASAFTSPATTAKLRPASPARAASMVAFSASRLVWLAIEVMSCAICSISPVARASRPTVSEVAPASVTARVVMFAASAIRARTSVMEADSSSAPVATAATSVEPWVAAATSALAEPTAPRMPCKVASMSRASRSPRLRRSTRAVMSAAIFNTFVGLPAMSSTGLYEASSQIGCRSRRSRQNSPATVSPCRSRAQKSRYSALSRLSR